MLSGLFRIDMSSFCHTVISLITVWFFVVMSLPPLFSMFLQYSYNLLDSAFVARLSENALTAVSLSFPITTLMNAVRNADNRKCRKILWAFWFYKKSYLFYDKQIDTRFFYVSKLREELKWTKNLWKKNLYCR